MPNYFKKLLVLFALMVVFLNLAQIAKAMEDLVRDEIETSSKISSFKPCFVKIQVEKPTIITTGQVRRNVKVDEWLKWSKDKGEMIPESNGPYYLHKSSDCPFMGHCSVHNLTELEELKTRLIAIQNNLQPYRSEQKKKEEILDLEIQIKKMKLEKLQKNKDK